jgi:hypothetical protein
MRQLFTKFRVSDHSLEIESGRYKNITREERICNNCNLNEIGDELEYHFFLKCTIFFTCHTFDRQGPHFCNSVDCFIKSPTSAKSSELAFSKKFILFNGISSIKSGLFNIILLNKLFLRVVGCAF